MADLTPNYAVNLAATTCGWERNNVKHGSNRIESDGVSFSSLSVTILLMPPGIIVGTLVHGKRMIDWGL